MDFPEFPILEQSTQLNQIDDLLLDLSDSFTEIRHRPYLVHLSWSVAIRLRPTIPNDQ